MNQVSVIILDSRASVAAVSLPAVLVVMIMVAVVVVVVVVVVTVIFPSSSVVFSTMIISLPRTMLVFVVVVTILIIVFPVPVVLVVVLRPSPVRIDLVAGFTALDLDAASFYARFIVHEGETYNVLLVLE
ncbi:hypothetical protein C8J57DRAFT_1302094 [Mycena rebaudengoi]|nr:hypothetical protein C8J57DRAFT_1302094 [Mycena rebaudengoi]